MFSGLNTITNFGQYGISASQIFRYSADQNCEINQTSLLFNSGGCLLQPDMVDSTTGMVKFSEIVDINGYTLQGLPPRCADARFEMQGLDEPSNQWTTVASCSFRYLQAGVRFLPGPCSAPDPLSVDLRPPWPLVLLPVAQAVIGSSFAATSLSAFAGTLHLTEPLFQVIRKIIDRDVEN